MAWPSLTQLRLLLIGEYPYGAVGGLTMNLVIVALSLAAGFVVGLLIGLGRLSSRGIVRCPCAVYVELIRATPLVMVLFWFYFLVPNVFGARISLFWTAMIALTVYISAYLAEVVRAGMLALPKGQPEAGYSIGLTHVQVLIFVTLPQALKMMIPAFVSTFISLFKESPALLMIGVFELMSAGYAVATLHLDQILSTFLIVGAAFFAICFSLSRLSLRLERRLGAERQRRGIAGSPAFEVGIPARDAGSLGATR